MKYLTAIRTFIVLHSLALHLVEVAVTPLVTALVAAKALSHITPIMLSIVPASAAEPGWALPHVHSFPHCERYAYLPRMR